MESIDIITQVIANLGFPIFVCLFCFWYINKQTEEHKAEMGEVTNAINNNTIALTRLLEKLEAGGLDEVH